MDEMLSNYKLAFDELNALVSISYVQASYLDNKQEQVKQVTDDFLTFLIDAYLLGVGAAAYMLGLPQVEGYRQDAIISGFPSTVSPDTGKMNDAIYKVVAGKDFADRVRDHVMADDVTGLETLADAEYHRVYNTAVYDIIGEYAPNSTKTWMTMLDDRVRDLHFPMEGMTIPYDEEFYTYNGDHGRFPGDFEGAENNVNCRCWLVYNIR